MKKSDGIIIIRSAAKGDVEVLVNWWSKGEVMAHAGFPNGLQTDSVKLLNRIVRNGKEDLPSDQILMISLENGILIGEMNYRELDKGIFEIGIKICEILEQGKGYGERAIKLLIDFITKNLKGNKIVLDTNLKNIGAQKFYLRLGFKKTGVRLECWRDQLGELQSAVDFEMELKN